MLNKQYTVLNKTVLNAIPKNGTVLDIGCYTGALGKALRIRNPRRAIYGLDFDKDALRVARKYYTKVIFANLNNISSVPFSKTNFDCIVLADVLEHLNKPSQLLRMLKLNLKKNGVLIISIPNFTFILNRLALLFGAIRQTESGITDKTHLHLMNKTIISDMLNNAGFEVIKVEGYIEPRKSLKFLSILARNIPNLFAYQFLVIAKKR